MHNTTRTREFRSGYRMGCIGNQFFTSVNRGGKRCAELIVYKPGKGAHTMMREADDHSYGCLLL